jgi:hypothetical protein
LHILTFFSEKLTTVFKSPRGKMAQLEVLSHHLISCGYPILQELPYSGSNDRDQDALLLEPYAHLLTVQGKAHPNPTRFCSGIM